MENIIQNLEEFSRFKFNFYLDIRKPLKSGLYSIKINLYDKAIKKHINFTIKRVDGIEISATEKDWIDIWKNKDKLDSFGTIVGEKTVYGRKFEIRTILKAKQDVLNELIMKQDLISLQEIKDAFYNHKTKETFDEYLNKIVSKTRAKKAAQKLIVHDEILTEISKKYGVQKRFIVTFWAVETNFGQYLGSFNVPHSLATLAHDGRRGARCATREPMFP